MTPLYRDPYRVSDWLVLGFIFSPESNDQSEELHGSLRATSSERYFSAWISQTSLQQRKTIDCANKDLFWFRWTCVVPKKNWELFYSTVQWKFSAGNISDSLTNSLAQSPDDSNLKQRTLGCSNNNLFTCDTDRQTPSQKTTRIIVKIENLWSADRKKLRNLR